MTPFDFLLAFLAGAICKTVFDWLVRPGKAKPSRNPQPLRADQIETNKLIHDIINAIPIEDWVGTDRLGYRAYLHGTVISYHPGDSIIHDYIQINGQRFYEDEQTMLHDLYDRIWEHNQRETESIVSSLKTKFHVDKSGNQP